MTKAIGIIGFGDFSRLMVKELSPYFKVYVATRSTPKNIDKFSCEFTTVEEVLKLDTIIPSMPSQFIGKFFIDNLVHINPKALIIDVCSVKLNPVKILTEVLPKTCEILATHPMFGPVSAAEGIKGLQIMMFPARLETYKYKQIMKFVSEELGLRIVECTPEEHDRELAYVLGLTQYIGRAAEIMDIPETKLRTNAYDDLLDMKKIQGKDSWELFESIMNDNPYATEVNQALKKAMEQLDTKLSVKK
ncbi:prephenate dehydrogenase/arogenate dehydrogenase family protein [Candidatus Saccharibacteria bacterium]|nr:prephenate dehydrogenase/arogenate dehydrogenase family protein [Candidatus Saccharibacteria bacterium]